MRLCANGLVCVDLPTPVVLAALVRVMESVGAFYFITINFTYVFRNVLYNFSTNHTCIKVAFRYNVNV